MYEYLTFERGHNKQKQRGWLNYSCVDLQNIAYIQIRVQLGGITLLHWYRVNVWTLYSCFASKLWTRSCILRNVNCPVYIFDYHSGCEIHNYSSHYINCLGQDHLYIVDMKQLVMYDVFSIEQHNVMHILQRSPHPTPSRALEEMCVVSIHDNDRCTTRWKN